MTTTAAFTRVAPSTAVQRIGRVVRLHFANPWTTITLPWIILGVIFLANLAIWEIIFIAATNAGDKRDIADGMQYSGSSFYIFVYMAIVAIQAINITFPFALGYGVTRRDYYLGTAVNFVILAAIYSAGLTVLGIIERATNGWGIGGRMFTAVYFGDNWLQNFYIFFVGMLFFFFAGAAFGAVFVRWKGTGLTFVFIGLGALVIGVMALIGLTGSWAAVGSFFASAGLVGSLSLSLLITAVAGVAGFLVLRRATPRG
ncbi:hypothetical protein BH11ACT4_BH11ACT4_12520 [soil metagenome]